MGLYYDDNGQLQDDGQPLPVDPAPLAITVTKDPFERAAERVSGAVKRNPLPVDDDRFKAFGPANPERPSYVMEPDLMEMQSGQHLPAGLMQEDSGRLYYADQPDLSVPIIRRPNLLPIAQTPEGYKFAVPRLLDIVGNVMGNVAAPRVAAKASEMVLGSGMTRKIDEFPTQAYHGTSSPGFTEFSDKAHDYMLDRALGVHVAKDPKISETFVKDKGGIYPVNIPDDAKFLELDQPLLPYIEDKATPKGPRNIHSDQSQIEKLVMGTAYKKDPEMLARYLTQARHVPEQEALQLAKDLIAGKTVNITHDGNMNFDKFIENFGGGKPYNEPDRAKAIELFKKEMQDRGYVGIKYINTSPMETANAKDATSYIVFDPHKHIQSKYTKTLMSDNKGTVVAQAAKQLEKPNQMGFYSALERAVGQAKINLATPEQWLGYLRNQPGVKSEELQHVLTDLPKEGMISKTQLNEFVKQNKVDLNETHLGEMKINTNSKYYSPEVKRAIKEAGDNPGELELTLANDGDAYRALTKKFPELIEDEDWAAKVAKDVYGGGTKPKGTTKYHAYQLPGGENYRELLLHLPKRVSKDGIPEGYKLINESEEARKAGFNVPPNDNRWSFSGPGYSGKIFNSKEEALADMQKVAKMLDNEASFASGHFDEHGKNLLAHARVNERTIDGKIGTHGEEFQSDWHQKGRKEGYVGEKEKLQPDFDKVEEKLMATNDEKMLGLPKVEDVLKEAVDKKIINKDEAATYKRYTDIENGNPVADAPFKKNWDELLLKRLIHEAAKKNHDFVSWTPGEAQAARYDLSKHIDKLSYGNDGQLWAWDKNGKQVLNKNIPKEELANHIGKEAAEKLLSQPKKPSKGAPGPDYRTLEGADLKIGGEGMIKFYDKMLVDKANVIAKKYGSKVEQKYIGYNTNLKNYEIAEKVGMSVNDWAKLSKEEKVDIIRKNKLDQPIHYLPLTPELKKKALEEGFPLFSSSPVIVPVDHNPFDNKEQKQYRLTPVPFTPEFK